MIHLTHEEYKLKTGINVDIQSIIETSEIHMIARTLFRIYQPTKTL